MKYIIKRKLLIEKRNHFGRTDLPKGTECILNIKDDNNPFPTISLDIILYNRPSRTINYVLGRLINRVPTTMECSDFNFGINCIIENENLLNDWINIQLRDDYRIEYAHIYKKTVEIFIPKEHRKFVLYSAFIKDIEYDKANKLKMMTLSYEHFCCISNCSY